MLDLVDELELANNAYRTKNYIVTQRIMFRQTEADGSMIMSMEVFYKRNQERDKIYEKVFADWTRGYESEEGDGRIIFESVMKYLSKL